MHIKSHNYAAGGIINSFLDQKFKKKQQKRMCDIMYSINKNFQYNIPFCEEFMYKCIEQIEKSGECGAKISEFNTTRKVLVCAMHNRNSPQAIF